MQIQRLRPSFILRVFLRAYKLEVSLAAGHSSETVDVVGTAGLGVVLASTARLIALLHALKHLTAASVTHLVS